MIAGPAGAYVVRDGEVTWQPAVDVARIVATAILGWVAVAWLISRAVRERVSSPGRRRRQTGRAPGRTGPVEPAPSDSRRSSRARRADRPGGGTPRRRAGCWR